MDALQPLMGSGDKAVHALGPVHKGTDGLVLLKAKGSVPVNNEP